jgi:hypothetical protein
MLGHVLTPGLALPESLHIFDEGGTSGRYLRIFGANHGLRQLIKAAMPVTLYAHNGCGESRSRIEYP